MKSIIDIINEGQEKLEKLGLKTKFIISNPQKHTQIEKFEKKFRIILPKDYKKFIINYGLLHVRFEAEQSYVMYQMLEINAIIDATRDLRDDLVSDSPDYGVTRAIAKTIFPFQYMMDHRLDEYYVFKFNQSNNEFHIHDLDVQWGRLNDEKYMYATTFADHINKFVNSIISKTK